jgi:hypothetical protein
MNNDDKVFRVLFVAFVLIFLCALVSTVVTYGGGAYVLVRVLSNLGLW